MFPNQADGALLKTLSPDSADAIDRCLQQGLLVARGDALAFRHELAREAVHEALQPHRRAALHAAVYAALRDASDADAALARQVHHAEGAGLVGEVAVLAPRAARYAAASGAHREAARLYALALQHGASAAAGRTRRGARSARARMRGDRPARRGDPRAPRSAAHPPPTRRPQARGHQPALAGAPARLERQHRRRVRLCAPGDRRARSAAARRRAGERLQHAVAPEPRRRAHDRCRDLGAEGDRAGRAGGQRGRTEPGAQHRGFGAAALRR